VSLAKDFRALPSELRLAAVAAGALAVSLILPWYQKSYVPEGTREFTQSNVSAFGVFTFVEAAVLLVAVAVLFLVWARSQKKGFHLPGGDGVAITIAGGWAVLLLVWRLFDKPSIKGDAVTVGIQWGIFGALLAAGALIAAGARVRAAHRPEPPNPAAEDTGWVAPERRPRDRVDRRPRDTAAVADALRERPEWEAETRRFRDDDAATRRMRSDEDAGTRRPREDDAATRRMRGDDVGEPNRPLGDVPEWRDDEATRRFRDDDAETRRMRGDDASPPRGRDDEATRRFRDDDAETRRMRGDDVPPKPGDAPPPPRERPPRLWDDDESA
jgi:hypothetical protein